MKSPIPYYKSEIGGNDMSGIFDKDIFDLNGDSDVDFLKKALAYDILTEDDEEDSFDSDCDSDFDDD